MSAMGSLAADRRGPSLYAAAALSLLAGLIHLWVAPEHFEEWWGYGAFFLVAAAAQLLYAPLALRWPSRTLLIVGIAGNLAIVALYLLTRTVGIPPLGPEAGKVEGLERFADRVHLVRESPHERLLERPQDQGARCAGPRDA